MERVPLDEQGLALYAPPGTDRFAGNGLRVWVFGYVLPRYSVPDGGLRGAELVAGDAALTRWAAAHPGSDLQQLRSLVRAARSDTDKPPEQRHGRAWRELFRFVRAAAKADGVDGDASADRAS